jgi:hypothetical protein
MNKFIFKKPISSLEDRIKKTPKDNPKRGHWTNERGLSMYVPVDSQTEIIALLKTFNLKGINYIEAMADFRNCSLNTVYLEHMSILRYINFSECDRLCADHWNTINYLNCSTWTRSKVRKYRKSHSLSWHERNDRTTCDLVPAKINAFFLHLGGIAECKYAYKYINK